MIEITRNIYNPEQKEVKKCGKCLMYLPLEAYTRKRNLEYKKCCQHCLGKLEKSRRKRGQQKAQWKTNY